MRGMEKSNQLTASPPGRAPNPTCPQLKKYVICSSLALVAWIARITICLNLRRFLFDPRQPFCRSEIGDELREGAVTARAVRNTQQ